MQIKDPVNNHYLYGLIPFLYVAESLQSSVYALITLVLVFAISISTVSISRAFITYNNKYIFFALISTTWVSIISLLFEAWFYPIKQSLFIYLFIIPMNTTLICYLDDCMHQQHLRLFKPALICTAGMLLFGLLRELLATGGLEINLSRALHYKFQLCTQECQMDPGISLFGYSAGALILAGFLLAIFNHMQQRRQSRGGQFE